jgi:hypothetical protein
MMSATVTCSFLNRSCTCLHWHVDSRLRTVVQTGIAYFAMVGELHAILCHGDIISRTDLGVGFAAA